MGNETENGHLLKQLIELFYLITEIYRYSGAQFQLGGRGWGGLKTHAGDASLLGVGGGGVGWGSGGILSQKLLKSRSSEMVLSTFSMRYF